LSHAFPKVTLLDKHGFSSLISTRDHDSPVNARQIASILFLVSFLQHPSVNTDFRFQQDASDKTSSVSTGPAMHIQSTAVVLDFSCLTNALER
jgi:hypothetical protein